MKSLKEHYNSNIIMSKNRKAGTMKIGTNNEINKDDEIILSDLSTIKVTDILEHRGMKGIFIPETTRPDVYVVEYQITKPAPKKKELNK